MTLSVCQLFSFPASDTKNVPLLVSTRKYCIAMIKKEQKIFARKIKINLQNFSSLTRMKKLRSTFTVTWVCFCCVDPFPGLGDGERGRRGVLQRDRLRAGALQCRRFQPFYAVAGRHYATQRARNKGIFEGDYSIVATTLQYDRE